VGHVACTDYQVVINHLRRCTKYKRLSCHGSLKVRRIPSLVRINRDHRRAFYRFPVDQTVEQKFTHGSGNKADIRSFYS
jgi:hypothetical protein